MVDHGGGQFTHEEIEAAFSGQIKVLSELQPGAQGFVYLIREGGEEKFLKIYLDAYRVRAERECRALERIQSPHLVQLHHWGDLVIAENEYIYTICDFIEGANLREIIGNRPLTDSEGRLLAVSIARAINDLWQTAKIVHRDIKPGNIIIRDSGEAVLIDLGIAKHRELTTITPAGLTWGTPGYMSPEQAMGRKGLTYRSDLFSLGVVLYESVSQFHPFSYRQELIGIASPEPVDGHSEISPELAALIHDLLEIYPLNRPASPGEVLKRAAG